MGFFDAYGIAPDALPEVKGGPVEGVYEAELTGIEWDKPKKDGTAQTNCVFSYTIPGYEYPQNQMFFLPSRPGPWDDVNVINVINEGQTNERKVTEKSNNEFMLAVFKKHLTTLGVPEDRLNAITRENMDTLVGTKVVLTLEKNKQGYINIARRNGVRLKKETGASGAVLPPTSAASAPASTGALWGPSV